MQKECSKCEATKPLDDFITEKRNKTGKGSLCKSCKSEQDRAYREKNKKRLSEQKAKYYAENKEKILTQMKEHRETNKDKIRERKRKYRERNKEIRKARAREYYLKNRERIKAKANQYYADNKEAVIQRNNEYEKRRRQEDPTFRLKLNVRGAVYKALKRENGGKKGSTTLDSLDYTIDELKEHLEAQFDQHMTWDNYGSYWHLDHILPQSLYPYDSLQHPNFKKMWALNNLQPLEAIENIKKGAKILQEAEEPMDKK